MKLAEPSVWRIHNFRRFWASYTISMAGTQISEVAIPLTAVTTVGASTAQVGLLATCQRVPVLIFGLLAGVVVDRVHRKRLLIWSDLGRGLIIATVPVAAVLGDVEIALLYAVSFAVGALTVFGDVGRHSFVPSIVPRESLVSANSKLAISESTADVGGPALGGILVQLLSAPGAVMADAISYLASAFGLSRVAIGSSGEDTETPPAEQRRPTLLGEVGEGIGIVFGNGVLRSLTVASAIYNGFFVMFLPLYTLYIVRHLDLPVATVGITFAAYGAGAVAAAARAPRIYAVAEPGRRVVLAALLSGAGLGVVPLVSGSSVVAVVAIGAGMFVAGAGTQLYNVAGNTIRQAVAPDRLLGRVAATTRFIGWSIGPLGGLGAAAAGQALGVRGGLAIAGAGMLLAGVWLFASPIRQLGEADLAGGSRSAEEGGADDERDVER